MQDRLSLRLAFPKDGLIDNLINTYLLPSDLYTGANKIKQMATIHKQGCEGSLDVNDEYIKPILLCGKTDKTDKTERKTKLQDSSHEDVINKGSTGG